MSQAKAFERHNQNPRYYQVQTRLTERQEQAFTALVRKTRSNRAETARRLIAKGLEDLQGVTL